MRHAITMQKERGFTILEFIIYIAAVGIVLGAAAMFALQFTITQGKAAVTAQASRNAQFAMSRIETEVRAADSIDVGASVFDAHPGTLTLATDTPATDPVVFTVTDGQLTVQQGTDDPVPLTEPGVTVTEFTLENLTPHARAQHVRVHLQVSLPPTDANPDVKATVELDFTVHIRRNDGFTLRWPTLL